MEAIFGIIIFALVILFIIGLFSPKKSLFWYKRKQTRWLSSIIYLGLLIVVSCLSTQFVSPKASANYKVITEKTSDVYDKAEIKIKLQSIVNEDTLKEIGEKYRNKYINKYRRVFIYFYVNDNKDCFATAHCEPDVKVVFLQEQGVGSSKMAALAKQVNGELIYIFYNEGGCMYSIYTNGACYFIKKVYPKGQTVIEEIVREDMDDRIKFTYKTKGIYGGEYYEFYMGDLNLCNKDGKVFGTAKKYGE